MAALIIGNSRTEEMVGDLADLSPEQRELGAAAAQRLLWFAGSGDVLVLPAAPRPEYLAYVAGLVGVDARSLKVLVPGPGALGRQLLTPDRLARADLRDPLRDLVRQRRLDRVLAVYKDVSAAQLATAVGLALPGHAFSAQGGDALVNSKAAFRAIAAGAGVPIAAGLVTAHRHEAEDMVGELLAGGHSAIVKQEFRGGGIGNEILSPAAGVRVAGALRGLVLPDAGAVRSYFDERWGWLTAGGRHRLVVERYLSDCDTVYAEYLIDEPGPRLSGVGEILMDPVPIGEIVPPQALSASKKGDLVELGLRLCRVLHGIGYRGYLSADAVLTRAGEIFVTETNGRISGSTHLHVAVRERVLAAEHRTRRVLLELHDWAVPSFSAALERLEAAGLGFRASTGVGVVLTSDLMPDGTLTYCSIAEDLAAARQLAARVRDLFAGALSRPAARPELADPPARHGLESRA